MLWPDSKSVVVIPDASVKNNVTTSISHVYLFLNLVKKTIYHIVNIITTEAKLFNIRCNIDQAIQIPGIACIIVVIDSIHAVHCIFDSSIYLYQHQLIVIFKKLREFFNKNPANSINFWNCLSNNNWSLHSIVNKETKDFNFIPLFLCKSS